MKFTKGDYIRYTQENEQEVIDGLISFGYDVYKHDKLNYNYDNFTLVNDSYISENDNFSRNAGDSELALIDRTEEFFAYLLSKNSFEEQLPSNFYIDCGDRIEVREWLDGMGFKWCDGESLILDGLDESIIYANKSMSHCYIGVRFTENYTLIKPKLTVTSFEVAQSESDSKARNKELESLKQAHKELGERIDKLCE